MVSFTSRGAGNDAGFVEKQLVAIGDELMGLVDSLRSSSQANLSETDAKLTEDAFLAVTSLAKAQQLFLQCQNALVETESHLKNLKAPAAHERESGSNDRHFAP